MNRPGISRTNTSRFFLGIDDAPYVKENDMYLTNIQKTIASNRTTSVSAFSTVESNYGEDEEPEYAELIDGCVFSIWFAAWFPVFVFATLWQSLTTFLPVVPAKVSEITNTSWIIGGVIWFGMLFMGFSLAFLQKRESAVVVVLVPVLLAQVATVVYVKMRPELSSRIPGHQKKTSTLCCIEIYSSVDWSSFFNYWEPIVPFIEFFQIVSVAISADMVPYWGLANDSSLVQYLLVIDVVVLNVLILLSITIFYFIGIGVFIHYQIDQKSNFGYVIYEFIPGAMFLTVSATALDAVKNGREVERFAGYLCLALYSSTAIFVSIYRFHEKWFADIVYTPTWLSLERIMKQVFAIISVYAFGHPRVKLGLSVVLVFILIGTFRYLKPCSKPWLVHVRTLFMLSGLSFLFAGLVAVNHGEKGAYIFLGVFQSLIGILLIVSVAMRVKDYMDEKPDAYAIEAVYDLEIKARSNMDKRFNKKMRQDTEKFHQEPTLGEFRFSNIATGNAINNIILTDVSQRADSDAALHQLKSKKMPLGRQNSKSHPLPPSVPPALPPGNRKKPPPVPLAKNPSLKGPIPHAPIAPAPSRPPNRAPQLPPNRAPPPRGPPNRPPGPNRPTSDDHDVLEYTE